MTAFVHEQIVCRFGVPTRLRVDRGSEFRGELVRYCKTMGIQLGPIATQNPRANGMAEKMVSTIKAAFRRCMAANPGARWWEPLPDVAWGIRTLPSKATEVSPFVLTHKQHPELGLVRELETVAAGEEPTWEDNLEAFEETLGYWQTVFRDIERRIARNDAKMVEEHARRADLERMDIRFVFRTGDLCLLRAPSGGQLKRRAVGPFTFVKYVGWRGVNAEIVGVSGKVRTVSAVNLRPLDVRTH